MKREGDREPESLCVGDLVLGLRPWLPELARRVLPCSVPAGQRRSSITEFQRDFWPLVFSRKDGG